MFNIDFNNVNCHFFGHIATCLLFPILILPRISDKLFFEKIGGWRGQIASLYHICYERAAKVFLPCIH